MGVSQGPSMLREAFDRLRCVHNVAIFVQHHRRHKAAWQMTGAFDHAVTAEQDAARMESE
jgi:hypothetical protein